MESVTGIGDSYQLDGLDIIDLDSKLDPSGSHQLNVYLTIKPNARDVKYY